MIGIKYLKYFPEAVFRLPTGITIYESPFLNLDGTRGVVGGPHHVFSLIEKHCKSAQIGMAVYLNDQIRLVGLGYQVNPNLQLLGYEGNKDMIQDQFSESILNTEEKPLSNEAWATAHTSRQIRLSKVLDMVENAGTEVLYRCINCRNCNECRNSGKIEYISTQEELYQHFIGKSVHADIEKGITLCLLF